MFTIFIDQVLTEKIVEGKNPILNIKLIDLTRIQLGELKEKEGVGGISPLLNI